MPKQIIHQYQIFGRQSHTHYQSENNQWQRYQYLVQHVSLISVGIWGKLHQPQSYSNILCYSKRALRDRFLYKKWKHTLLCKLTLLASIMTHIAIGLMQIKRMNILFSKGHDCLTLLSQINAVKILLTGQSLDSIVIEVLILRLEVLGKVDLRSVWAMNIAIAVYFCIANNFRQFLRQLWPTMEIFVVWYALHILCSENIGTGVWHALVQTLLHQCGIYLHIVQPQMFFLTKDFQSYTALLVYWYTKSSLPHSESFD